MKVCKSFKNRLLGNMFKKQIQDLAFPNCRSIHTFFMRKPIDVFMTDKEGKILHIFKNVKPFHIIWFKKNVFYTYETEVNKYHFKVNDFWPKKNKV